MIKKITIILGILLIGFIGWKGWSYYKETYVGQVYYAVIKSPLPEEKTLFGLNGDSIGQGFTYDLNAISESGDSKKVSFDVVTTGSYKDGSAYEEGTAFKIKASSKRILEKQVIAFNDIPKSIQSKLK